MMQFDLKYVDLRGIFKDYREYKNVEINTGTSGDNVYTLVHPIDILKEFIHHIAIVDNLDVDECYIVICNLMECINNDWYVNLEAS